ncbi:hypothetical protein MNBD_ALPHA04-2212, partial [hydrothermal vent metagenome]
MSGLALTDQADIGFGYSVVNLIPAELTGAFLSGVTVGSSCGLILTIDLQCVGKVADCPRGYQSPALIVFNDA